MKKETKRALISVYDKTGIVEFAKALVEMGFEIVSSSGTYKKLSEAGIPVTEVTEITKFPECLSDRVKTLNPLIQGGILADRDDKDHQKEVEENGIPYIDIVVLNLYPFEKTVSKPGATLSDSIKQTDIGGPTNIRAAAKNFKYVIVVIDPKDYDRVLEEMKANNGATTLRTRFELARKVWRTTAAYDTAISNFWDGLEPPE